MKWWNEHFDNCDYWPTPKGKDPGEAYRMGIDLEQWIKSGLPPALTIEDEVAVEGKPQDIVESPAAAHTRSCGCEDDLPDAIRELARLLRNNPAVTIINQPSRYTVLRDGRYVGGRINELVFRDDAVLRYIQKHPATRITGENFIQKVEKQGV